MRGFLCAFVIFITWPSMAASQAPSTGGGLGCSTIYNKDIEVEYYSACIEVDRCGVWSGQDRDLCEERALKSYGYAIKTDIDFLRRKRDRDMMAVRTATTVLGNRITPLEQKAQRQWSPADTDFGFAPEVGAVIYAGRPMTGVLGLRAFARTSSQGVASVEVIGLIGTDGDQLVAGGQAGFMIHTFPFQTGWQDMWPELSFGGRIASYGWGLFKRPQPAAFDCHVLSGEVVVRLRYKAAYLEVSGGFGNAFYADPANDHLTGGVFSAFGFEFLHN